MDRRNPRFAAHVKDRYPVPTRFRELLEAAETVESFLAHPGFSILGELLEDEIATVDDKLDGSKPLEHTEYAHLHGQRRGLRAIRDAATAILDVRDKELERQRERHESTVDAESST